MNVPSNKGQVSILMFSEKGQKMVPKPNESSHVLQDNESSHVLQNKTYLIDYDLSTSNGTLRQRFYRALNRYKREESPSETGYSSQSVISTQNIAFAFFVRDMAAEVGGSARIWEAKPIGE